jgi:hypothetical protein
VAVVSGRTAVLLDLNPQDPLITRIVTLLDEGGGVDDVLDALVSTGLKTLADFGAFHVSDDGVRMVVRGQVGGSVGSDSDLHAEHTMWYDTWQPGVAAASLEMPTELGSELLPIGQGVVLASAVVFESTAPVESSEPVLPVSAAEVVVAAEPATSEPAAEVAPQTDSAAEPQSDPALEISSEVDPGATIDAPLTISGEQLLAVSSPAEPEPPGLITGMPWAIAEPDPAPAEEPFVAPEPAAVPDSIAPPRPVSQPAATFAAAPTPDPNPAPVASPVPGPVAPPVDAEAGVSTASSAPFPVPSPAPAPALVAHPALQGLVRPPASPGAEISADRTINRASLVGLPAVLMVVAARCSEGHLSPAYASSCRVCRGSIPQQHPIEIPRPTLGQLRLSTGGVVSLDRPAILGRNPRVPQGYVGEQPNLVRLSDPDKDVSGQHLEVSLDYWNVLVCDLGSTNGTEVILPGEMPVVLRPNDPVIIEPGTRVVMAGSISFLFEVLP